MIFDNLSDFPDFVSPEPHGVVHPCVAVRSADGIYKQFGVTKQTVEKIVGY